MDPADIPNIINVTNLYAIAVDSHRYDLFDQVFAEDIRCDFGGGAACEGRAILVSMFADIHAVFSATQHVTSGHVVRLDGDRAHCFSYVHGRFRRPIEGKEAVFDSTGWYDDMLNRTPQGWRIKDRVSRMVTYGGDIRVMQAMPGIDTNYVLASLYEEVAGGQSKFFSGL